MSGRHLAAPEPAPDAARGGRHVAEEPMTTDDDVTAPLRLREPLRLYLYSVGSTGIAVALAAGLISGKMAPLWTSLIAAALAVPTTEIARSKVWSPASVAELRAAPGSTYAGYDVPDDKGGV